MTFIRLRLGIQIRIGNFIPSCNIIVPIMHVPCLVMTHHSFSCLLLSEKSIVRTRVHDCFC
jgi:hypothetical protein